MSARAQPHAIGVDGCRGGWVVARPCGAIVVQTFRDVLEIGNGGVVGVDMPIGLPDGSHPRACDLAARARLPGRGATVFPALPRPLLACTTYKEALALSRSRFGRGISAQAFALAAKLREVDAVMTPELEGRVVEVHPEGALTMLLGRVAPSKHTGEGLIARRAAIEGVFGPIEVALRGAKHDDVIDAYAALWSAQRFAKGEALVLGDGERDERGLVMRVVV